jgi:flagellar biosynthesis protein FlhF
MNLKTYRAPTMSEAISQVKQELGRDAVIVRTRNVRKRGIFGWLSPRKLWEVTASCGAEPPRGPAVLDDGGDVDLAAAMADFSPDDSPDQSPPSPPLAGAGRYVATEADAISLAGAPDDGEPVPAKAIHATPPLAFNSVSEEVGRIRQIVEALLTMQNAAPLAAASAPDASPAATRAAAPSPLKELRLQMLRQEVGEELAEELLSELSLQLTGRQLVQPGMVRQRLQDLMARRVMTGEPAAAKGATGRARVCAFIGPTGVGKTTTIAKLAANFRIRERKKVGMVTIDTYRIAAVDQLKTYAELIEVPLHVVLTPGELCRALDLMSDCDVVLIDTAGRSQNDRLRLNQLGAFLRAAEPDDISLVVSATSSRSALVSTLERFLPLGVSGVVMTKLDEATALGSVLNVAAASRLPIRYVTTGQDVPDDISPADPRRLARCIVEGAPYVA